MFKRYKQVKKYGSKADKVLYWGGTGLQAVSAPIAYTAIGMLGPVGFLVGGLSLLFGGMYKRCAKDSVKRDIYVEKQKMLRKYAKEKAKKEESEGIENKLSEDKIKKEIKKKKFDKFKYFMNHAKKDKIEISRKYFPKSNVDYKFKHKKKKGNYKIKVRDKKKDKYKTYKKKLSIPNTIKNFNELESILVDSSS